jgi:hypothetical protein
MGPWPARGRRGVLPSARASTGRTVCRFDGTGSRFSRASPVRWAHDRHGRGGMGCHPAATTAGSMARPGARPQARAWMPLLDRGPGHGSSRGLTSREGRRWRSTRNAPGDAKARHPVALIRDQSARPRASFGPVFRHSREPLVLRMPDRFLPPDQVVGLTS